MSNVFFDQSLKNATQVNRKKSVGSTDRSHISSKWNEAVERKESKNPRDRREVSGKPGEKKEKLLADSDEIRSPYDLFNQIESSKDIMPIESLFALVEEEGSEMVMPLIDTKKDKTTVKLHEDTSYLNSMATPMIVSAVESKSDGISSMISPKSLSQIEELARKLVDEITIMKHDGRTETTITLKHPPMFEGSQVTITEFDSAKKELNIK